MQILKQANNNHYVLLFCILILSGYIHLYNPVGFPDIFFDEGIYMRRAMNVAETGNPQEGYFYDHPYFGQLVLGALAKLAGFPQTVEQSLEMSYLVPRLLMGVFAVFDTFLIYKIAEKKFGKKTAAIATIIFAVMPMTWLLRRILLDTILLPFLLSSIYLAIHSKDSKHPGLMIFGSSVCLGLSIFTKITAITMIPFVGYLIYTNTKSLQRLTAWLVPMFGIPMIWPAIASYFNQLDLFFRDVLWQAGRGSGGFFPTTILLFLIDPIVIVLSFLAFAYAIYKRNLFLIFWSAPFLLFVNTIGFFQYFHFILIMPVMCIAIAFMLNDKISAIKNLKLQNYTHMATILFFAVFGTFATMTVINTDMSSAQFEVIEFTLANFDDTDATLLAGPVYTWIISDVYGKQNVYPDYRLILFQNSTTTDTMLIADPHFMHDIGRGPQLQNAYSDLNTIKEYYGNSHQYDYHNYPFTSLQVTAEGSYIEIKTSWDDNWKSP
ncbi:MAG: glycosyltransferase family 39 protein [Nitrosopumilus sp.]|nr:glycosyltransferase family 39 protein [Nitrosopumilus sp.]